MITLTLPSKIQAPDDWQTFRLALSSYGLSLVEISQENNDYTKVQIQTSSRKQENLVIDLVQLCFSTSYKI